jgi:predicted ABC-type exoprotein transport system permease subunit
LDDLEGEFRICLLNSIIISIITQICIIYHYKKFANSRLIFNHKWHMQIVTMSNHLEQVAQNLCCKKKKRGTQSHQYVTNTNFSTIYVAWLICDSFLLLNVVAYAYVTWPFAIGFMIKMCTRIWQRTRMYTHDKKLSIGLG